MKIPTGCQQFIVKCCTGLGSTPVQAIIKTDCKFSVVHSNAQRFSCAEDKQVVLASPFPDLKFLLVNPENKSFSATEGHSIDVEGLTHESTKSGMTLRTIHYRAYGCDRGGGSQKMSRIE